MARKHSKEPTPERLERMDKVMQMRVDGLNFREIGKRLNISHTRAYQDFREAIRLAVAPSVDEYLAIEMGRNESDMKDLNIQLKMAMKEIMGLREAEDRTPMIPWMDTTKKLVEAKVKLAAQRHRLLGLDGGIKIDASVDVTDAINAAFADILEADPVEFQAEEDNKNTQ